MTESNHDTDKEALKSWYMALVDKNVREMAKVGAIAGTAIEGKPIWVLPYKILIAKVWDVSQKSDFIWTISGEGVISDHIPGPMAATPRDAAKHFSLKWQMDANKLRELAMTKTTGADVKENMDAYTNELIQYAEALYEVVSRDEFWGQMPKAGK